MVIVTDKQYYMDGYLKNNLDFCILRIGKGWDDLIIIEGDERIGKSTLGKGIGYYIGYETKRAFTADNIFFDVNHLSNFARTTRRQVIVWDEAALGALASDWTEDSQKILIKTLITCGKNEHFFIFIIPKFKLLKQYFAVDRSIALLQVTSPDRLQRGFFKAYGKDKKEKLYYAIKKDAIKEARGIIPSFRGRFTNINGQIIDEEVYDKNKEAAILSIGKEVKSRTTQKAERYLAHIMTALRAKGYNVKQIAELIHVDRSNFNKYLKSINYVVEGNEETSELVKEQ